MSEEEFSEASLLAGRVRLLQPRKGHRVGTDAVLAAALAEAEPGDRIVDLGSASGAIGLMLAATVPETRVVLVERDPVLVELARRNIGLNGREERVAAVEADVFALKAQGAGTAWPESIIPLGKADLVVTNPPFFDAAGTRASPDPGRRAAHVMAGGGLAEWAAVAARLLRTGGRLVMIHRADALATCLSAMSGPFGAFVLLPILPRADQDATRIVLSARKGGRSPLAIRPPLVLHGQDGRFTPETAALHETGRFRAA